MSLLASQSMQSSLALFVLGKDDVDLRVGRDRDDYPAGRVQAEISILPPRRLYIDRHHGHRSVYAGNLTE